MDTFVTKAARLNGPRDIELIERELVCGEDDIIVKNHLMGICGSDKNFYRGYLPPKTAEFRQDPKFPFLLGHESGGTVVAVGSRVADYKVGDKVMAFGWNNNFAEYFAAKSFQLQPVPYGLDMDIASPGRSSPSAPDVKARTASSWWTFLKASWPSPAGSARTSPSTPDRTTSSRPSRI